MRDYRKSLLKHLDHILGQLDLGPKPTQQYKQDLSEEEIQTMKGQYGQLREVLLEVDKEVMNMLTCESFILTTFLFFTNLIGHVGRYQPFKCATPCIHSYI